MIKYKDGNCYYAGLSLFVIVDKERLFHYTKLAAFTYFRWTETTKDTESVTIDGPNWAVEEVEAKYG